MEFFTVKTFISAAVLIGIGIAATRLLGTREFSPDQESYISKMGRKGWSWHIAVFILTFITAMTIAVKPPTDAAQAKAYLETFGMTLVQLTLILVVGNGAEWFSKAFGKNATAWMVGAALGAAAAFGPAPVAAGEKLFFLPNETVQATEWRAIKKQQDRYKAAKAKAYKTHKDDDYDQALALAMFPMQRGWILNNRAYHYIKDGEKKGYTGKGLARAERWLQQAFHYCWMEDERIDGPTGANALRKKINHNLVYIRELQGAGGKD